MKRLYCGLLLLCVGQPCLGEDFHAVEQAKRDYEAKVDVVVAPITAAYLKQLDKMKKAFMADGDLKGARAAQREIDSVTIFTTIVGKWTWSNGGEIEFLENGTARHGSGGRGRWTCLDKRTRRYEFVWSQTRDAGSVITLSQDGMTMFVNNRAQ